MSGAPTAGIGLDGLDEMLAEMRGAPELFRPSELWEELNERNLGQLANGGFDDFKRTVNGNYFQFVPPSTRGSEQFRAVLEKFVRNPSPAVLRAGFTNEYAIPGESSAWRSRSYAFYIAALWEYARRRDSRGLLNRLAEPDLGHPVAVSHRGRLISEDLCNSALEVTAMLDGMDRQGLGPDDRVIELGAGYGRLTWAFLAGFPGVRCTIVDIPPALAVSQRYLTELFPDRPAFRFRHFDDESEVRDELESSQIAFLTPNQLQILGSLDATLFASISSLHEMRPDHIAHYIDEAGRHAAGGHFYSKQWLSYANPSDEVTITQADYPIPPSWRPVFERVHPVQTLFFESLYAVEGPA